MYKVLPLRARLLYATARNIFSTQNRHILPYIAYKGDIELLQHLIDHGIDVNTTNHWDNTALHVASYHGNIAMVNLLLDNNANPNLQDANLHTPLHFAISNGHIDIVRLLLNHESDVNLISKFNETALDVAWIKYTENLEQSYLATVRLLITHIVRIEHANLVDTSSQGFLHNKGLINESEQLKELEQQCHKEIEEMCSISVGSSSCLSFFDIFVLKKDMNILARCANNPDIVRHQNKFSMYSPFIEKSIEEGEKRAKLLQGAVESIDEIFESNQDASQKSQTSWSHLPPEVRFMILENLDNDDLTKIQRTDVAEAGEAGAEVEAEVGGAHAIYEEE
ncbi:ankyrin repeat-containing protein 06_04 [Orientia tsutsugamushi str. Ikeda]|uniref:Ankyrin repeat-containing protein 06_02 n=1 Tax=Orientia tsutsugamushi (strain Ikeda) TaxID=334380 RepID=B3CTB0_ORITI|nr:ankyrin repeat domain-containing protein [Orientia tsutsugamushi]BAG40607.1 ankyrin repeat-containing protein 06_02 [Orientia tsutsugamushi str. Ikeda]BAG40954.1 ankyrin repeat-containing protein 06_03 [Orientia tsutsugamushi str. Ikeda]BAG41370.1 ankyrin repeat-containing protein 06_04 [Orientia tsutsugamushi str. Ikeda]